MYLSRFGVKNYKCLGEIDIPLTPIHVLIGENDAGKTSLLEAMGAFCAGGSEQQLAQGFPQPWEGRELVFHGSPEPQIEFSGEWTASEFDLVTGSPERLSFRFAVDFLQEGRECSRSDEVILVNDQPQSALTQRFKKWRDRGMKPIPPIDAESELLAVLAETLKPAQTYMLDPQAMAVPAAIDPEQGKFLLQPDGFGLSTLLLDIMGYDAIRFVELSQEFCRLLPQFRKVRVERENGLIREYRRGAPNSRGTGVGAAIYFESQNGQVVRAQQASDGAILLLGFLALAYLPDPPSLLLLEEPERGIYPKRLAKVIELFRTAVGKSDGPRLPQIIMTTHSPFVASFFEPEEVTFLRRTSSEPDGPVTAWPMRDAPNVQERLGGEFYLGELWYNLSEEELFREP